MLELSKFSDDSQKINNNFKNKTPAEIKIKGRVVLNLFQICKSELSLRHYDIENVMQKLLKVQISNFSNKYLTEKFIEERSLGFIMNYLVSKILYVK